MIDIKKIIQLIVIGIFGLIFSGCFFSGSVKKAEISLNKDQLVAVQSKVTTSDQAHSTDSSQSQETTSQSQKAVTPKEAPAPPETSSPASPAISATPKITSRLVNWGFSASSGRIIDTIIIHSSYNAVGSDEHNLDDIINKEYKPAGVSPHYIIARDGKIYQLVADKNIAYHAGVSKMPDGRTGVNDFSIGIEIVETKAESPDSAQYSALKNLISYLKGEYKIKYVLGHSDIAPGRKDDPWNFDWGKIK